MAILLNDAFLLLKLGDKDGSLLLELVLVRRYMLTSVCDLNSLPLLW